MEALFIIIFAIIALGIFIFSVTVLRGYTLTVLWKWFIIPMFHLPPITMIQAIALMLVINFLFKDTKVDWKKKTEPSEFLSSIGTVILQCGMILLIGWIVTKFM